MNKISNKEKVELLNQTLSYLSSSVEDEETIMKNLEELEGDYYTFFDPQFTLQLMEEKQISLLQKRGIDFLYEIIKSTKPNLWNKHSFDTERIWQQAKIISEIIQSHFDN